MNTYQETLDWMFTQLPMYQRKGQSAIKKDLTNIIMLADRLDNPQKAYKKIHVGGTNGKGSTSHMLASILQEAGYRVGLYTSPHLKDFRERIKVNGKVVSESFIVNFIEDHYDFFLENRLSFFEMTVGMAFQYFQEKEVDVAIIEVGLGGRLDSTNIINPVASIITNISLDHVNMLGNTLDRIAYEKAGIIKKEIPVIIGEKTTETESVFKNKADSEKAPILFAEDLLPKHNFTSDLKGIYQKNNIRTVLVSLEVISKIFDIKPEHVIKGLDNVVKNTSLLGRWQIIDEKPMTICDTGHNVAGVKQIVEQLNTLEKDQLHLVLGFVNDKDVKEILEIFPDNAFYYFGEPDVPRKMKLNELKLHVNKKNANYFNTISDALKKAQSVANENDVIFVGGSTFVVSEIL